MDPPTQRPSNAQTNRKTHPNAKREPSRAKRCGTRPHAAGKTTPRKSCLQRRRANDHPQHLHARDEPPDPTNTTGLWNPHDPHPRSRGSCSDRTQPHPKREPSSPTTMDRPRNPSASPQPMQEHMAHPLAPHCRPKRALRNRQRWTEARNPTHKGSPSVQTARTADTKARPPVIGQSPNPSGNQRPPRPRAPCGIWKRHPTGEPHTATHDPACEDGPHRTCRNRPTPNAPPPRPKGDPTCSAAHPNHPRRHPRSPNAWVTPMTNRTTPNPHTQRKGNRTSKAGTHPKVKPPS
mmetsp:Transcript_9243/g.56260  ORF Transcript_9243/g.56260 Transcript_9243/m.56260 type:complete len:292 (+) Transcript_9243:2402-3277(+)